MRAPFFLIALAFALQVPLFQPDSIESGPLPLTSLELQYLADRISITRSSYCIDGLQSWVCATCDRTLQMRNISLIGEFDTNVFAFTAFSAHLNTIVITFRGTKTVRGWIKDLRIARPDWPFAKGGAGARVHLGFLEVWLSLKPAILHELSALVKAYPQAHLLISGHSLGGAVSTIAAADLFSTFPDLNVKEFTVVTFGSPRVGNRQFSEWYSTLDFKSYRVVHYRDLVAHLPQRFLGFQHVVEEVWIKNTEQLTLDCPAQYDGRESSLCSNSLRFFSVSNHLTLWNGTQIGMAACKAN